MDLALEWLLFVKLVLRGLSRNLGLAGLAFKRPASNLVFKVVGEVCYQR